MSKLKSKTSKVSKNTTKKTEKVKVNKNSALKKGKNDLLPVFNKIKDLLKKYEPPFIARADYESRYDLWSEKDMIIEGKKRKEVYFTGLIIKSD
jgi:hypothetical protein